MKSIHSYILIASDPAIPSCAAIPDGQPWRDGTSRDSKPRDDPLPSDVDVHRPSAISSLVQERILLVTSNSCQI
ncbi:hypothetical protein COCCADRAFT_111976 [Bipolaris zeicola 26-R-13]|uniref:Uncharacterized protein n=1 Tax=Cochliobolus carbonum (strain 26-R-13) TaxID=930089 RepID=W6Y8C2_COCC2|nr:uncharacterized protein COCCADRAFT_111976 [Bipolaris zeicola 26-R-13]EUC27341.1 hypothetical protein COCCADRAFT_111976 [Bipolaris zeicola 26-R-13]